jgi:hypothetical protein
MPEFKITAPDKLMHEYKSYNDIPEERHLEAARFWAKESKDPYGGARIDKKTREIIEIDDRYSNIAAAFRGYKGQTEDMEYIVQQELVPIWIKDDYDFIKAKLRKS